MAKRKRNVSKRKVPKRKRRKRKFGMAKIKAAAAAAAETAKKAGDFAGKAKTMFINAGGKEILPLLKPFVNFDEAKKQLKDDEQKKIANDIQTNVQKDLEKGDIDFKSTVAYFKETAVQKGTQLKEAFYKILAQKQIYTKMEQQVNNAFKNIPKKDVIETGLKTLNLGVGLNYDGFLSILNKVYTNSKDVSKKLSFNILGSLLSKNPTESDYKKNLLDDATKAAAAAKKAAGTTITKEQAEEALSKAAAKSTSKEEKARQEKIQNTQLKGVEFGKRKRGPSASLKRMCKKHGVRLMVKRGKTRVYKSSKVLKEQCQRKLKRKLKKNFGRKKIKRSGIMPPRKRKTRGKKRRKQKGGAAKLAQILKASARRQAKRAGRGARSAARYVKRNPGRVAGYTAGGLAGLGALGLGGLEARRAMQRYRRDQKKRPMGLGERAMNPGLFPLQKDDPYASPTERFIRGVNRYPFRRRAGEFYEGAKAAPRRAKTRAGKAYSGFMDLFKRKQTPSRQYGKRRRRKRKFGKLTKKQINAITLQNINEPKLKELKDYARTGEQYSRDIQKLAGLSVVGTGIGLGYRGYQAYKRDKRKKKRKAASKRRRRSFGKKAKKPSAALRRMCKKLKVRLTLKRGGKRVYKSEAMLKKQCKTAMKRKKKKSKK